MRIPSGKTDQKIFFYAADATDLVTAETGLSSFTVYRSRNGGAATAYTTPTVAELSSANMPGLYCLTVDEDTTIASGSDSEEYAVTITATGMAPVHRVIELYRRDTTSGETLTVSSGTGNAAVQSVANNAITASSIASNAITSAKVATDAIGAAQLAADAVTEIQSGLATSAAVAALPTANGNADALLDRAAGVETGLTVRQAMRLMAAALFGKASGLDTTTAVFRDTGDTKNRISAIVDANGNRTAVTLDAS